MAVTPFPQIPDPSEQGMASPSYVMRKLREWLSKLVFTSDGKIKITPGGEGQVHFALAAGALGTACEHPFQVYVTNVEGVMRAGIRPGYCTMEGGERFQPTLSGQSLTANPPPAVNISPTADLPVWLDFTYLPILGSAMLGGAPLSFLRTAVFEGTPSIRIGGAAQVGRPSIDWDRLEVRRGSASMLLAVIRAGVVEQEWFGSVHIVIADDLSLRFQMGGA